MQWSWERLGKCNQEDPGSQTIRTPKDTGRSQRSCVQYGTGRRKQRNAVTAESTDFHGCRLSFLRWKTGDPGEVAFRKRFRRKRWRRSRQRHWADRMKGGLVTEKECKRHMLEPLETQLQGVRAKARRGY